MAIENKKYAASDLERVKYTADSNTNNSTVQTFVTNHPNDVSDTLRMIHNELKKINDYFAVITDVKI